MHLPTKKLPTFNSCAGSLGVVSGALSTLHSPAFVFYYLDSESPAPISTLVLWPYNCFHFVNDASELYIWIA